jgi:hypothetical protein
MSHLSADTLPRRKALTAFSSFTASSTPVSHGVITLSSIITPKMQSGFHDLRKYSREKETLLWLLDDGLLNVPLFALFNLENYLHYEHMPTIIE